MGGAAEAASDRSRLHRALGPGAGASRQGTLREQQKSPGLPAGAPGTSSRDEAYGFVWQARHIPLWRMSSCLCFERKLLGWMFTLAMPGTR